METDASCGSCNGLFQPLDLEKSFHQGRLLSRGRIVALFMVAISTVNSCLMITDCYTFPPQLPPPNLLHLTFFLFLCKAKHGSLWSPQGERILSGQEHGALTDSQCVWWTRQYSPFCYAFHPISSGEDSTCMLQVKKSTSMHLPSLIAKGSDLVASLNILYHSSLLLQFFCHGGVIQRAWTNFILDVTSKNFIRLLGLA